MIAKAHEIIKELQEKREMLDAQRKLLKGSDILEPSCFWEFQEYFLLEQKQILEKAVELFTILIRKAMKNKDKEIRFKGLEAKIKQLNEQGKLEAVKTLSRILSELKGKGWE